MARDDVLRGGDLTELVTDVGPAPLNVGGLLVLGPGRPGARVSPDRLAAVLAARAAEVPRLRRRLGPGDHGRRGAARWVDHDVRPADHAAVVTCPAPGDERALLDLVADVVLTPLPRDRPLWRVVVVDGLVVDRPAIDGSAVDGPALDGPAGGGLAAVVVLHHAVADGFGGLALLGHLADAPDVGPAARPVPSGTAPPGGTRSRIGRRDVPAAGTPPPTGAPDVPAAGSAPPARPRLRRPRLLAPRTSLNVPTGPTRRLRTVTVGLEAVRTTAHRHGATVNDVLLAAAAGALGRLLTVRGEHVPEVVVSVPVALRDAAAAAALGNRVGVMPVRVPLDPGPSRRLATVAAATRARRRRRLGRTVPMVDPVFRALAAVALFRRAVDRQRLVTTFLTNLRGPDAPLTVDGVAVRRLVPVTPTAGNVAVAFAALSYDGALEVTVVVDPDVTDADDVAAALRGELAALGVPSEDVLEAHVAGPDPGAPGRGLTPR